MSVRTFLDLGVPGSLATILAERSITTPTPIQAATLPDSLAGRDVLGRGRTGSGKTYAFLLPMVSRLMESGRRPAPKRPRALVLAPTRELASQIEASLAPLAAVGGLRSRTIFGGVSQGAQASALAKGVDVVVATPGRLEDLIKQGLCSLDQVEITVVDEADHMSDLGFLPAVRRILDATPKAGQRMLFSATLDGAVNVLVKRYMTDPVTHEADSVTSPISQMEHHILRLERQHRLPVLVDLASAPGRTVVFTRTKHGARTLARQLNLHGVPTVELHGNLAQNARTRNMEAFHSGRATTLVATDIAARGIHVDDVALVIHADPPSEHKAYLHRSGRTARAGAGGMVITLMSPDQVGDVRDLTRRAGINPTTTKVTGSDHAALARLVPGERVLVAGGLPTQPQRGAGPNGASQSGRRGQGSGRGGSPARGGASGGSRRRPSRTQSGSTPPSSTHSAAAFSGRGRRG